MFFAKEKAHQPSHRTFHTTNAAYCLPNDAAEQARLNVQDLAYVQLMHGKVFQAAVPPNIKRVLDVGCGTGIVTRYFGRSFPSADVYGIDLSPGDTPRTLSPFLPVSERIQEVWNSELWHSLQTFPNPIHPHNETPGNVWYIQGDVHALAKTPSGIFRPNSCDFYFHRMLVCGMTSWQAYVQNAASLVRSGGFVEMQDRDLDFRNINLPAAHFDFGWWESLKSAAHAAGMDWNAGTNLKQYMQNAGLVDIEVIEYRLPMGTWLAETHPETRRYTKFMLPDFPDIMTVLASRLLASTYNQEKMLTWQADMQRDLAKMRTEHGWYQPYYVTVGRKV